MIYITLATKETIPPPATRSSREDWRGLTAEQRIQVVMCLCGDLPLADVALRVQTFVRRHGKAGV